MSIESFESKLIETLTTLDEHLSAGDQTIKPAEYWKANKAAIPGILGDFARHKTVLLTNADLAHGTLRVLVPCKIILCETIIFNPNTPEVSKNGQINRSSGLDWLPEHSQAAYIGQKSQHSDAPSFAYRLGFFAAITVEHTQGTIIDLNGYTLKCHEHFAVQQRFHALIELANQPFIPNQGPAAFGQELRSAGKVWIRNGKIGRSSHHAIHGNQMKDVMISDVTFENYEVAAISLNGGCRILIQDCQLEGTSKSIKVLGSYSAARFTNLVGPKICGQLKAAIDDKETEASKTKQLEEHLAKLTADLDALRGASDAFFNYVMQPNYKVGGEKPIDPAYDKAQDLFENKGGLVDGNPYGIALHSRGVLVDGFLCMSSTIQSGDNSAKAYESSDITIRRVNIANTRGKIREIQALLQRSPTEPKFVPITDTAGSLFRFFPLESELSDITTVRDGQPAEMDASGAATLSVLGQAQISLAQAELALVKIDRLSPKNRMSKITEEIVDWAMSCGKQTIRLIPEQQPCDYAIYKDNKITTQLQLKGNGDSMFHVNKGAIGLFAQAVDNLTLDRVVVSGVSNSGLPGSNRPGPYTGGHDGGHPKQNSQIGYSGAACRGIYLGACFDLKAHSVKVSGVQSSHGTAYGFEVGGGTCRAHLQDILIGDVTGGSFYLSPSKPNPLCGFPNVPPDSIGLRIDASCHDVRLEEKHLVGPVKQPAPGQARLIQVEAAHACT